MAASTIQYVITAQSGKFVAGLEKAQQQTKKFKDKSTKNFSGVKDSALKLTAALGGITAALSFARATKETINFADELAKTSQRVGVSAENLSTLKYAAELSGSSYETLTKGLRGFSKAIDEGNAGVATYRDEFERLGITLTNNDGSLKSTEQLMGEVSDQFATMDDGAEKTAAAMTLFGSKAGAELIPLLNGGSSAINEMQGEARDLGLEISTSFAGSAEKFNDSITRLSSVCTHFMVTFLEPILPMLTDLANHLQKNSEMAGSLGRAFGLVFQTFASGIITIKAGMTALGTTIANIAAAEAALFSLNFSGAKDVLSQMSKDQEKIWNDLLDANEKITSRGTKAPASEEENKKESKKEEKDQDKSGVAKEKELARARLESEQEAARARLESENVAEKARAEAEKAADEARLLAIEAEANAAADREAKREQLVKGGFSNYLQSDDAEMFKDDQFLPLEIAAEESSKKIEKSLGDYIFDPFSTSVGDMAKGFTESLRRMAADAAANQIITSLLGMFGGSGGISKGIGSLLGFAEGGLVKGKGSTTSDSNLAWLSNREYVQPAASVMYYGLPFMEAVRKQRIPKELLGVVSRYSRGGLVEGNERLPMKWMRQIPKFSGGGLNINNSNPVNLKVVNVSDVTEIDAAKKSDNEEVVMNIISKNKGPIRNLLS